jgi:N-acetylmuramoyl-L-alanine amidase
MKFETRLSPNCNERGNAKVDTLILHYTGMKTAAEALDRLCDPAAEVSAHYLIDEDGTIVQLVAEADRAWHAGVSSWRGHTDINSRSVGIEIVNPGHEWGYRDFTEDQYTSLIPLCQDIIVRCRIPAVHVLGHSDVAPARKADPGERFDWQRLAAAGIGIWPTDAEFTVPIPEKDVRAILTAIGYDVSDLRAAVTAFQRRFRPSTVDGVVDEETRRLLAAVRTLI